MSDIYFDIETESLTPEKLWMIGTDDGDGYTHFDRSEDFNKYVEEHSNDTDTYYAHNGFGFDYPVCERLWSVRWPEGRLRDTMVLSRLANPSRAGGHSLDNLGSLVGIRKDEFSDYGNPGPVMASYMKQDVAVLKRVKEQLLDAELAGFDERSIELEHAVAPIIAQQERNGWKLDQRACILLLSELREKKYELEEEVHRRFVPLATFVKEVRPKTNNDGSTSKVGLKHWGFDARNLVGGPYSRIEFPDFNLGSRQQIARHLRSFGWVPTKFTDTGQDKVDETVLANVEGIPEAALIADYLTVSKRIAMAQSWLDLVHDDGRVRGKVNPNGAVTGRMTHNSPNVAQTTAGTKLYGHQMRECWTVEDGYSLVGMDAEGLELRMLAHYMGDNAYITTVVEGRKEDGTDVHTSNQRAAGLATRDQAKTFIYAFLYGAGDAKIGSIVGGTKADGRRLKASFLRRTPALATLKERVETASSRGWLRGLDGRRIAIRRRHAALNSLLQGAGAVVMKQALVNLNRYASANKIDYKFVGNIHDEIQTEVWTPQVDDFGKLSEFAIVQAGRQFNLRCPLAGKYQVGPNWAHTH